MLDGWPDARAHELRAFRRPYGAGAIRSREGDRSAEAALIAVGYAPSSVELAGNRSPANGLLALGAESGVTSFFNPIFLVR